MSGICGDCSLYEKETPWSGTCKISRAHRSPGQTCGVGKFTPHASTPTELPAVSFPAAKLRSGVGFYAFSSVELLPMVEWAPNVEVIATVGAWSMVRYPPSASEKSSGSFSDLYHAWMKQPDSPFVVETIHLEFEQPTADGNHPN